MLPKIKTNNVKVRCFTLAIGDEEQDKGFVLHQVEDGLFVGVIFRRGVW